MPIVTRTGNSVNVNLTIPFIIWSGVWVLIAALTGAWGLLWVAAIPWLFMLAFMVVAFVVGITAMLVAYRRGVPVTVTTRKGVRVVRRGQEPVWKVRR
jgi:hypothetical protein